MVRTDELKLKKNNTAQQPEYQHHSATIVHKCFSSALADVQEILDLTLLLPPISQSGRPAGAAPLSALGEIAPPELA